MMSGAWSPARPSPRPRRWSEAPGSLPTAPSSRARGRDEWPEGSPGGSRALRRPMPRCDASPRRSAARRATRHASAARSSGTPSRFGLCRLAGLTNPRGKPWSLHLSLPGAESHLYHRRSACRPARVTTPPVEGRLRGRDRRGRKRDHNEDSFLIDEDLKLYVVADGMGGHAGGGTASRIAVETIDRELRQVRTSQGSRPGGAHRSPGFARPRGDPRRGGAGLHRHLQQGPGGPAAGGDGDHGHLPSHEGRPGLLRPRGRQPRLPRPRGPHPADQRGPQPGQRADQGRDDHPRGGQALPVQEHHHPLGGLRGGGPGGRDGAALRARRRLRPLLGRNGEHGGGPGDPPRRPPQSRSPTFRRRWSTWPTSAAATTTSPSSRCRSRRSRCRWSQVRPPASTPRSRTRRATSLLHHPSGSPHAPSAPSDVS